MAEPCVGSAELRGWAAGPPEAHVQGCTSKSWILLRLRLSLEQQRSLGGLMYSQPAEGAGRGRSGQCGHLTPHPRASGPHGASLECLVPLLSRSAPVFSHFLVSVQPSGVNLEVQHVLRYRSLKFTTLYRILLLWSSYVFSCRTPFLGVLIFFKTECVLGYTHVRFRAGVQWEGAGQCVCGFSN